MTARSRAGHLVVTVSVMGFTAALPPAAPAQGAGASYPRMAPIEQYRMTPSAEITLARSAAPASISGDAAVLVLGATGYETAAQGRNGFVCLVERSWANDVGNAGFWNPKMRGPTCYNPAAVRSVLPAYLTRTEWVLSGLPEEKIAERSRAVAGANGIQPDVGAMCYMLSRDGYLGDDVGGPWHPHLMFFLPRTPAAAWGANVEHSPVFFNDVGSSAYTTFMVTVARWSDGARDSTSRN